MYKFRKILVGLDQSPTDQMLLDAACQICQLSGSEDIYFTNFLKDFNIPEKVLKEFPDLKDKAISERKEQIEAKAKKSFTCGNVEPKIIVKPGQPTRELMKFIEKEEIDLVILGRKDKSKGGILINRIARRAGSSLLVMPEKTKFDISRILVPIDFSNYSKMALEKAVEIGRTTKSSTKIITQNVYQVPTGYHYTGKSFDEFAGIMMENAFNDFKTFTKDLDSEGVDLDSVYSLDKDEDIIQHIYKTAKNTKANMIIIGAKGRTSATALFIGSKAEKLIQLDTDIPMMVIRPKGSTAGIREYLEEI